jgi:4-hydroxy-4-methyl-2-oxoglutarate aldolase
MEKIISEFKKLDTTCVSDALDKLGIPCGLYGIKPIIQGKKICGRAFTVHYVPCGINKGTVGDFLDDVKAGEVIVIDNGGRDYCTVWGDIMTITANKMGIEGTVIDGVCRDIPGIKKEKYAVYSKGWYMVTGKDRVEVDAVNVPISVSGIQIKPGDIILGDDTGVIVIPKDVEEKALEIARSVDKTELLIINEVLKGNTLKESRTKLNYHNLQTKE